MDFIEGVYKISASGLNVIYDEKKQKAHDVLTNGFQYVASLNELWILAEAVSVWPHKPCLEFSGRNIPEGTLIRILKDGDLKYFLENEKLMLEKQEIKEEREATALVEET